MPPRSLCFHRSLASFTSRTLLLLIHLLLFLLPLLGCGSAAARRMNYTIDDELGDSASGLTLTYAPAAAWTQGGTPGVDGLQAFDGTWHAPTFDPDDAQPRTVSATFEGSAVYVYHILANAAAPGSASLGFFLDDEPVGSFVYESDGSGDVAYNVPVYANDTMLHGNHTIRVETTGPATADVLFDYIVYTAGDGMRGGGGRWHGGDHDDHDDGSSSDSSDSSPDSSTSNSTLSDNSNPTSSTSATPTSESDTDGGSNHNFRGGGGGNGDGGHHPNGHGDSTAGVIVGGTIGGVALLAIIVGTFIFFHRRSRRTRPAPEDDEKRLRGTGSGNGGAAAHHEESLRGTATEMAVASVRSSAPSVSHMRDADGYTHAPSAGTDVLSDVSSPSAPMRTPVSSSTAYTPAVVSAKRAQRQAEIAYQIKMLEAQMSLLQAEPEPESDGDSKSRIEAAPSTTGTVQERVMQDEIQLLRDEVASLRTRWELEQRMGERPASEAPPRYSNGD